MGTTMTMKAAAASGTVTTYATDFDVVATTHISTSFPRSSCNTTTPTTPNANPHPKNMGLVTFRK